MFIDHTDKAPVVPELLIRYLENVYPSLNDISIDGTTNLTDIHRTAGQQDIIKHLVNLHRKQGLRHDR